MHLPSNHNFQNTNLGKFLCIHRKSQYNQDMQCNDHYNCHHNHQSKSLSNMYYNSIDNFLNMFHRNHHSYRRSYQSKFRNNPCTRYSILPNTNQCKIPYMIQSNHCIHCNNQLNTILYN